MKIKDRVFAVGLDLNKTEQRYLERLLKHNWSYSLSNTDLEYRKGLKSHQALKQIADTKQGNYRILWHRVSEARQNYDYHKSRQGKRSST